MTPQLRDYQTAVLDKAREHYVAGKRWGIIQAATGGGKGHILAEQARRTSSKQQPVVIIAHRRKLVNQISDTLTSFGVWHGVVMEGVRPTPALVQVCSRDTLYAMKREESALPAAKLVIVDEAHCEYGELLEFYKDSFGTGYTATPCKGDGRGLGHPWQFIEPAVKTADLIPKYLVPVKCFNPEEVGRRRVRGEKVKVAGDPFSHWKKFADGRKTVVFAANRRAAMAVLEQYLNAGVAAEYLDGDSSDEERDAVLGTRTRPGRLETGKTTVVVTVSIMVEGVDVPCLSCAQILRGCGSFVLWRQAIGRIMRPYPGKEFSVLLDHAGAAFEFGMPDWEVQWDVNPDADASENARKKAKNERVVCCPECGRLFSQSPDCPGCGWKIPKPKKSGFKMLAEQANAVLTEFQGQPQSVAMAKAAWQKLWERCLWATVNRGGAVRQAAGMFFGHTKKPVWECGVTPMPEPSEFSSPVAVIFPEFARRKVRA